MDGATNVCDETCSLSPIALPASLVRVQAMPPCALADVCGTQRHQLSTALQICAAESQQEAFGEAMVQLELHWLVPEIPRR